MRLADFAGRWRIARRIDDRMAGRVGRLAGMAVFSPQGDGLRYVETGLLRFPGQPALEARQSYCWREDGQGVAVAFSDGRPFHRFALTGAASQAAHWCDPDRYEVRYDFAAWPDWSARWKVAGPRKDYVSVTRYRRG